MILDIDSLGDSKYLNKISLRALIVNKVSDRIVYLIILIINFLKRL